MPNFVISDQQIAALKDSLKSMEEAIHAEAADHVVPAASSFIQVFSGIIDELPATPSKEQMVLQEKVAADSTLLRDCCEIMLKVNRQLTQGHVKEAALAVSSFIQSRRLQAST